MSEEELGEGSLGLRARGGGGGGRAVGHGQVLVGGSEEREEGETFEEEAPKEEEVRASLLRLLDQDLLACDVQLSLFVAAASSYRQDTTLRPFPPFFLTSNGERDVEGLQAALASLPSLEDVRRGLNESSATLSAKLLKLLLWVFGGGLRLRCLSKTEAERVMNLPGRDSATSKSSSHPQPQVVLEVQGPGLSSWEERVSNESDLWAFHGSRLDNFHSILNFGLQQHRNKVSLFGEGIYLARDLGVCLAYSHRGQTWQKSALGNSISAVAVAQVLDHPTQVNLHSADARGEVEGSEGGRLPDMYVVVRNNELLKIRYIMIYRHETSALRAGRGIIAAWVGRNRMLLLLLAYAAMLALIGLANSQWVKRWLRRKGFSS